MRVSRSIEIESRCNRPLVSERGLDLLEDQLGEQHAGRRVGLLASEVRHGRARRFRGRPVASAIETHIAAPISLASAGAGGGGESLVALSTQQRGLGAHREELIAQHLGDRVRARAARVVRITRVDREHLRLDRRACPRSSSRLADQGAARRRPRADACARASRSCEVPRCRRAHRRRCAGSRACARSVLTPNMPSSRPASKPSAFSLRCNARTSSPRKNGECR